MGDMRAIRTQTVINDRGLIMDRNGEKLAVSVPVWSVWADCKDVADNGTLMNAGGIRSLAEAVGLTEEELRAKLSDPKRRHEYIARQLSDSYRQYIEDLRLPGIYVTRETRRFYPTGEISSQLVGLTDIDGRGIEGIENSEPQLGKIEAICAILSFVAASAACYFIVMDFLKYI